MTESLEEDEQTLCGSNKNTFACVTVGIYRNFTEMISYETLLSSTTQFKRSVCWKFFEFPAHLPLQYKGALNSNYSVGRGIPALVGQFCHKGKMLCTHGWNGWFGYIICIFLNRYAAN